MKNRQSFILFLALTLSVFSFGLAAEAAELPAAGSNPAAAAASSDGITLADQLEITLELHHIGERTGVYSGEMKNGLPHGTGTFAMINPSGLKMTYEGEWVDGQMEGHGKMIWPEGPAMTEEGAFVDSEILTGTVIYDGYKLYEGEWKNLVYEGQGTFFNRAGDVIYTGTFKNSMPVEKDKVIAAAKDASFDSLMNDYQLFSGNMIKAQGKIIYVWEDEDGYSEYLINTDESDEKPIYISYQRSSEDEHPIQVDDYLTVYGIFTELYTYDTVDGRTITVPFMVMYAYE